MVSGAGGSVAGIHCMTGTRACESRRALMNALRTWSCLCICSCLLLANAAVPPRDPLHKLCQDTLRLSSVILLPQENVSVHQEYTIVHACCECKVI